MSWLLKIIGYGWCLLGLCNFFIVNDFAAVGNETQIGISLILHGMLYFFPGLIIGALGTLISRKAH